MSTKFSENVIPLTDYEAAEEECTFMRAVVAGLADLELEAGQELSIADAKARLGLI